VILLDENVPLEQADLLRGWSIRCRVIGRDVAELSIGDDDIVVLLHRLKRSTFITRDRHFFRCSLCHPNSCLVMLDALPEESAMFTRRFHRHPAFHRAADRLGIVARAHHDGIHFWQRGRAALQQIGWSPQV
jgi:hypothetical protein